MGFMVWDLGFGVWGLGFGVRGLKFGVWGLEFRVWRLEFGFRGLGCTIRLEHSLHRFNELAVREGEGFRFQS